MSVIDSSTLWFRFVSSNSKSHSKTPMPFCNLNTALYVFNMECKLTSRLWFIWEALFTCKANLNFANCPESSSSWGTLTLVVAVMSLAIISFEYRPVAALLVQSRAIWYPLCLLFTCFCARNAEPLSTVQVLIPPCRREIFFLQLLPSCDSLAKSSSFPHLWANLLAYRWL